MAMVIWACSTNHVPIFPDDANVSISIYSSTTEVHFTEMGDDMATDKNKFWAQASHK